MPGLKSSIILLSIGDRLTFLPVLASNSFILSSKETTESTCSLVKILIGVFSTALKVIACLLFILPALYASIICAFFLPSHFNLDGLSTQLTNLPTVLALLAPAVATVTAISKATSVTKPKT